MNDTHSLSHTSWNCKYHNSVTPHPLNHTGTYFYTYGQILIHLRLEYQTSTACQTPGEVFAIIGLPKVSQQKSLQKGPVLSLQP